MREVYYLAHPVRGDEAANLANAKWWLRFLFHHDPDRVYVAPWIAEVEAFAETGFSENPDIVTKALADDVEVVRHCDGIILVGGRVSSGMQIERDAADGAGKKVIDWSAYRTPLDVPLELKP